MDRFQISTRAAGSVFVRSDDDLVLIASSVKDGSSDHAAGTLLARSDPAYAELIAGHDYTSKASIAGKDYMSSYAPIKDSQGRVFGVLEVSQEFTGSLKKLSDEIVKIKIGKTGYFYALDARPGDEQGTLRIHPSKAGKNIIASKDAHGFEFIRDIINRKEGVTHYLWINEALGEKTPREKIVAFAYLKQWEWVIAAGSYVDELNTEGVFLRNSMLSATLLVVLILVSVFVLMAHRWISSPLKRAVSIMDLLAAGDFRQIAGAVADDEETQNEVEQLERGIHRMSSSLRDLLGKIHAAAAQVTSASEKIAASAGHASETSENQSAKTTQVSVAMHEISATVDEVSKNTQRAAEAARIAADTARDGGQVVSETLATMREISASTETVSAKISELGQSSNQIGAIASVISDIAGQTNLLALNAAIEAARAGEQGRGFAVVAGEVRRLAERTAAATSEISGMIDNIQREAREAVEAMHGESEQVTLGVAKTESSGQALDRIIEMAGRVGDMVAQIATSATQQSEATEEVNTNVAQIAEMTTKSSNDASETARACAGLSGLALSMQAEVDRFKLDSPS